MYADSLTSCGHAAKIHLRKPKVQLVFMKIFVGNVYAKIQDIPFAIEDCSLYGKESINNFYPFPFYLIILRVPGWNLMPKLVAQQQIKM